VVGALLAGFLYFGLSVGAQGVLWAELVQALGIGKGAFGVAQLVPPLVAICLLLRGGPLSARLGKRRLAVASLLALGGASLILALAPALAPSLGSGFWALVVALAILGLGMGLFETAVNGAAMDWESSGGRPLLNALHAGYSAGAVGGATGAGLLLGLGWRPEGILFLLALLGPVLAGATRAVSFPVPAGLPARHAPGAPSVGAPPVGAPPVGMRQIFNRPLLLLAAIAALGSVGESVANLWSVIYLSELGAGALAGGAAFALANAAMLAGRVLNAPLVARHGARPSLLLSGAGLLLASGLLLLPGVPLAVAGFALTGLAVAGIVPTTLSAAGRLAPGHSGAVSGGLMAAVYLAFAVCPPLVGWLAERTSLQAALLVVGLSGAGILGLTLGAGAGREKYYSR
jgi:MFS family permease